MPTVGVLGAGTMGSGIAQVAAAAGWTVRLSDREADYTRRQRERIAAGLDRLVEKGRLAADARDRTLAQITVTDAADHGRWAAECDLIIEAVIEDMDVKCAALRPLVAAAPRAVIASNTSSLSITRLGAELAAPERVVGMHFFNPVPLMPLVEVIAGRQSAPDAVQRTADIARAWGKTVVNAQDTPGFIVNRVARGYYLESLRMFGEGIAGVDEIDQTLKKLGGFRMGPFELMDLIGIDVNWSVSNSVWEQMGRPARLEPHPVQARLVQAGRLGRKSKRGFYSYESEPPLAAELVDRRTFTYPAELHEAVRRVADAAVQPPRAAAASEPRESAGPGTPRAAGQVGAEGSATQQYIFARVLVTIINEAAMALDEQVATAADIDTAMKLGTNYPRGPLEWAESIGRRTCAHLLRVLDKHVGGGRFAPAEWLRE